MLISNSSPLISLARIGKIQLLHDAYSRIVVPKAVYEEITHDLGRPGARDVLGAPWLHVVDIGRLRVRHSLRFWLDPGESEAIYLAQNENLPLAIDERRGRQAATSLGVRTTGTVGILLAFKKLGLVDEVTPLLDRLVAQGIRLSTKLVEDARSLAGESRPASSGRQESGE